MTTPSFESLSFTVPLRQDPPGVYRVGNSRVLLELVLNAFNRGESPEGIVRSFPTLDLADVYAVISRYLADPEPFDRYLQDCEQQAEARDTMTKIFHGRIRGRTIELEEDPGIADGQKVQVQIAVCAPKKKLPGPPPGWKPGNTRTVAGALADLATEEEDRMLEEIHQDRKRERRAGLGL